MSDTGAHLTQVGNTLTVHVPIELRMTGGRKLVIVPGQSASPAGESARADDGPGASRRPHPVTSLVKALARAFRWRRLLESGLCTSIADLAAAEGMDKSFVSKVLRLTLLEPRIVEGIIDATDDELNLERLLRPFPTDPRAQKASAPGRGRA